MKKFEQFIMEMSTKTYVYYNETNKELWHSYGQGSGQTAQLPSITKYLNSDNSDKSHYDSLVDKIVSKPISNKVLKKVQNVVLYELPVYETTKGTYDIFGGDVKSIKTYYMTITKEKSNIINFFKSKNEAMNWIKSI